MHLRPPPIQSCSRDPIGYVDGRNLYRSYFVVVGVDPLGLQAVIPIDEGTSYAPTTVNECGNRWEIVSIPEEDAAHITEWSDWQPAAGVLAHVRRRSRVVYNWEKVRDADISQGKCGYPAKLDVTITLSWPTTWSVGLQGGGSDDDNRSFSISGGWNYSSDSSTSSTTGTNEPRIPCHQIRIVPLTQYAELYNDRQADFYNGRPIYNETRQRVCGTSIP